MMIFEANVLKSFDKRKEPGGKDKKGRGPDKWSEGREERPQG